MNGGEPATIFALSSGSPPAAVAIVRISGPRADDALLALSGRLSPPRTAVLTTLRDPGSGDMLDRALALRFPGPASATGEDVVEIHIHGGRAVVAAVLAALSTIPGLRAARPGEFTRRAFENGRMDLAEAEGLADLLSAETEGQRRAALALAGGALSRKVEAWREAVLQLAAGVEALLDFSDESDVGDTLSPDWTERLASLRAEIAEALASPPVERLKDGVRVAVAGPPNAGKSSLINRLAGREAAIVSDIAGTTRDVIETPVAIAGRPFLLLDTAGLRDSSDPIERIGVERANAALETADLILWLGDERAFPHQRSILVAAKADIAAPGLPGLRVSAVTGEGISELIEHLLMEAEALLPTTSEVLLNARHRAAVQQCDSALAMAGDREDLLLVAEALRVARKSLDEVVGRAGVEDMLDRLFGSFCIGK